MKKLATIIIFISVLFFGYAQNTSIFIQKQSTFNKNGYRPLFIMNPEHDFNSKIGISSLVVLNPGWAEILIGPKWMITPELTIKALIGYEQAPEGIPLRGFIGVTYFGKKWSTLTFAEYGNTGYWYLHSTLYKVHKYLKAGVHAQRFVGIGPRIDIPIGKFNFWNAYVYDIESKTQGYTMGLSLYLQTQK